MHENFRDSILEPGDSVVIRTLYRPVRELEFLITAADDDPERGLISWLSPLGNALLGKKVGDKVEYTIGPRTLKVETLAIRKKYHDQG